MADAHELAEIRISAGGSRRGSFNGRRPNLTFAIWQQIRDKQQAFSGLLAWSARQFNTSPGGEVRLAEGLFVTGDYFAVLGVPAMLGRVLTAEDDVRGCGAAAAVVSYA